MTRYEEFELISKYSNELIANLNKSLDKCHADIRELRRVNNRLRNIIKSRSKPRIIANKKGRR